jgi:serine/threonine-protein kinase
VKELLFWGRLLALGVLLALVGFWTVMNLSVKGGTVTMPSLKGLPKAAAELKLSQLGLKLQVREERYSSEPFGTILEQSLEPGAKLKRGRTIAVVLSMGAKILQVPAVLGSSSSRQARLLLEQGGLAVGRIARVFDPDVPRDSVMAQSPEAGSAARRGEHVSLLVSAGPREVARVMPDLRGRSLREARALVERMGLVLTRVETADPVPAGAAPGSVVFQSLSPSTRVLAGWLLTLRVAPGGAAAVPARLARLDFQMPADTTVERRLRIVVRDELGERVLHNAMEKPGASLRKEFRVYGTATAEISVNNAVVEKRDIP